MLSSTSASVALTLSMVASVIAQGGTTAMPTGSVLQVTYPGGLDGQTLVGSIVSADAQKTTVVITCPPGTDSNDCGFNPPVTITAGPSTLAFTLSSMGDLVAATQDCKFSSGGGVCTYVGVDDIDSNSASTTTTETSTLEASDIVTVPVTITAGATGASSGGSSSASSGNPARTTSASSGSANGSGNGGSSSTSTPNDAKVLVPGAFAAALMGFAAVYL